MIPEVHRDSGEHLRTIIDHEKGAGSHHLDTHIPEALSVFFCSLCVTCTTCSERSPRTSKFWECAECDLIVCEGCRCLHFVTPCLAVVACVDHGTPLQDLFVLLVFLVRMVSSGGCNGSSKARGSLDALSTCGSGLTVLAVGSHLQFRVHVTSNVCRMFICLPSVDCYCD